MPQAELGKFCGGQGASEKAADCMSRGSSTLRVEVVGVQDASTCERHSGSGEVVVLGYPLDREGRCGYFADSEKPEIMFVEMRGEG